MEPTCAGVARPEYSETVQKGVDYLERHYSDAALSLKGLAANYLFMNPDYVSRQFLQQTGYRLSLIHICEQLLTLSTCDNQRDNGRILVVARETK